MAAQLRRILRKKQVSQMLGISIATLDRMLARGEFIRPFRISSQAIGWEECDVSNWIEGRKATHNQ
jgi:prophage regulatory protein